MLLAVGCPCWLSAICYRFSLRHFVSTSLNDRHHFTLFTTSLSSPLHSLHHFTLFTTSLSSPLHSLHHFTLFTTSPLHSLHHFTLFTTSLSSPLHSLHHFTLFTISLFHHFTTSKHASNINCFIVRYCIIGNIVSSNNNNTATF